MHFDCVCSSVSPCTNRNPNAWMHTVGHERNEDKHTHAKTVCIDRNSLRGLHWWSCVSETGARLQVYLCSATKGELQGNSSKEDLGEVCPTQLWLQLLSGMDLMENQRNEWNTSHVIQHWVGTSVRACPFFLFFSNTQRAHLLSITQQQCTRWVFATSEQRHAWYFAVVLLCHFLVWMPGWLKLECHDIQSGRQNTFGLLWRLLDS